MEHYESISRGVRFLIEKDTDGNCIPEGTGIMEIGSFYIPTIEMIDVAVYSLQAFRAANDIFQELSWAKNSVNIVDRECAQSPLERVDCDKHNEADCTKHLCVWSPISAEEYSQLNLPGNTPWCHFPLWTLNSLNLTRMQQEATETQNRAQGINSFLMKEMWLPDEEIVAEFFATTVEVIPIIKEALSRVQAMPNRNQMRNKLITKLRDAERFILLNTKEAEQKKGWNIFQSWITSIAMEQRILPNEMALQALKTATLYSNQYGMYVTGIDKPDEIPSQSEGFQNLGLYTNAVMTLPTGVQAMAESKYFNISAILQYLEKLSASFSYETPGTLHELSPSGGCYVQAWSIYSIAVPVVKGLYGIDVESRKGETTVHISPLFPPTWPYMRISRVPIGHEPESSFVSYSCEISASTIVCLVELHSQAVHSEKLFFHWILEQDILKNKVHNFSINSKPATPSLRAEHKAGFLLPSNSNRWELRWTNKPKKDEL